ncbi:hypothetical protein O6H91_Y561600 [Diphasiastrum complanatum]|nr:hypothetical protein O6H91_Y561600 [Diphasiastrum complanatum]
MDDPSSWIMAGCLSTNEAYESIILSISKVIESKEVTFYEDLHSTLEGAKLKASQYAFQIISIEDYQDVKGSRFEEEPLQHMTSRGSSRWIAKSLWLIFYGKERQFLGGIHFNILTYASLPFLDALSCFIKSFTSQSSREVILVLYDAYYMDIFLVMKGLDMCPKFFESKRLCYQNHALGFCKSKIEFDTHSLKNHVFTCFEAFCKLLLRLGETFKEDTYILEQVFSLKKIKIVFDFKIRFIMDKVHSMWTSQASMLNLEDLHFCSSYDLDLYDLHEAWKP